MSNNDEHIEKLIAIAKNPLQNTEPGAAASISDAQKFSITFELMGGEEKIPGHKVYELYEEWMIANGNKKEAVSKNVFMRQFSLLFKKGRSNRGPFYFLNKNLDYFEYKIKDEFNKRPNRNKPKNGKRKKKK